MESTLSGQPPAGYDAIVVGGGHNGMVSAFYLARSGLRVLILERRPFVGGMAVTEEFAPGYRASTGAYVLAMLREAIWRDMRLAERGLRVDPTGPSLNLFAGGEHLYLHEDPADMRREIAPLSSKDARAYQRFSDELEELAGWFGPLFSVTPFDPRIRGWADLERLARVGLPAIRHRKQLLAAAQLFAASCAQYLDERFESDVIKGALSWFAINDSVSGPSTPGTAYVLLHEFASSEAGGGVRKWGFVRGGIGTLTALMADAVCEAGAEIRTGATVERILVECGRVVGVVLESGDEVRASVVVSNADPKRTMLTMIDERELPEDYVNALRAFICEGTSIKVNLAVGELPRAAWDELNELPGDVQPYHRCIVECNSTVTEMDLNQAQARAGIPAIENPHVELCCPTVFDPSLGAAGQAHRHDRHELAALHAARRLELGRHQGRGRRPRHRPDRPLLPQPSRRHRAPTGALAARHGEVVERDRRPRAARRHGRPSAVLPASRTRLRRLPHADLRTVPLRSRHAPRRRHQRRQRHELRA